MPNNLKNSKKTHKTKTQQKHNLKKKQNNVLKILHNIKQTRTTTRPCPARKRTYTQTQKKRSRKNNLAGTGFNFMLIIFLREHSLILDAGTISRLSRRHFPSKHSTNLDCPQKASLRERQRVLAIFLQSLA